MRLFLILVVMLGFFNCANAVSDTATNGGTTSNTTDDPTKVICNIVKVLSGPISQAIATLVIIITGYSFFVGKVSIGMLFIVAAGIMFVFGAQTIMGWVLGDGATKCS